MLAACGSSGSRLITADADGTTITVHVGEPLHVRLDTTSWRFAAPSDTSVLRQEQPEIAAGPEHCHVEFHCGHASVDAWPLKPGDATITAYLTYCGEARWCDLSQVAFRVTVHVVR